jgi:hypothetical protein
MSTILKKLESLSLSANFGKKNADGFENRVLKAVWSEGKSKLVQLVSSATTFGGNILMPDGYTADQNGLERLQKDINALLALPDDDPNHLRMYGFTISVKEATDGEHTKVKNLANEHIIENFPRAWDSDDRQACLNAVKRDVAKSIDKGKLEFAD